MRSLVQITLKQSFPQFSVRLSLSLLETPGLVKLGNHEAKVGQGTLNFISNLYCLMAHFFP